MTQSVIVAGSRSIVDIDNGEGKVREAIEKSPFNPDEVVSGTANGVDKMGERWAEDHNVNIKRFPADWDEYGRSAGPIRNGKMAKYADGLIAIRVDMSDGTTNMINLAEDIIGKEYVYVKEIQTTRSLI